MMTLPYASKAGAAVTFYYRRPVDWSRKDDVAAVSAWRNQARSRANLNATKLRAKVVPYSARESKYVELLRESKGLKATALAEEYNDWAVRKGFPQRSRDSILSHLRPSTKGKKAEEAQASGRGGEGDGEGDDEDEDEDEMEVEGEW